MSIRTACVVCRNVIDVPDHFAGRTGRCKHCGAELVIPGGAKGIDRDAPKPKATRPMASPPDISHAQIVADLAPIELIDVSLDTQLRPPLVRTGRARLEGLGLLWVGVPLCIVTVTGIWAVLRVTGANRSEARQLPNKRLAARREQPNPRQRQKAQPEIAPPKVAPAPALPQQAQQIVRNAQQNPPPRRIPRIYLSPSTGPESILRMSLDGLDEGQRQVVETLRRREADPERTSFVELWPTGSSVDPTTEINKRHAVVAILRSPNGFGAMVTHRELIYLDDAFQITGALGPEFTSLNPYFFGYVRIYYPNVPKSEEEKRNEGMIKGLIDFANQPPMAAPKRP